MPPVEIRTTKRTGDRMALVFGGEFVLMSVERTSSRDVSFRLDGPLGFHLISRDEALAELLGEGGGSKA